MDGGEIAMKFYVTDSDNNVVGKFDGVDIELKDGHERHEVESVEDLSEIEVDSWDSEYDQ